MSSFLEKVRAKVPENVRQKLLAMKEDDDQSISAVGEPVRVINVNEKSIAVPQNEVETVDINKVQDIPKAEPKTEPVINIAKDDEIEYNIGSGLNRVETILDAEYQIPYGKEPFLEKEQILDAIKIVTLGSLSIDAIFAILHVGIIPCILLVIIASLVHVFLVQEYNHPTYV
jgi:hypothetical protein